MRPMRRGKGIVHIEIAIFGNGFGEFRIVLFLARPEPGIFQKRNVAIGQYTNRLAYDIACDFGHEHDFAPNNFLQRIEHHGNRHFAMLCPLGTTEMRQQQDLCALVAQFQNGRQQGAQAHIIGDTPVGHGDIQIHTHQRALAFDIPKIVQCAKCHIISLYRSLPMTPAVSTMRLEKPHSLSYQLRTRTSLPSITAVSRLSMVELAGQWL